VPRYRPVELGSPRRRHTSPWPVRPVIVFFVIFVGPGLLLISGFQSGRGQVFAGDRLTNGFLGGALAAFGVYLAVLAYRKGSLSVTVHDGGFVWRENGQTLTVRWNEVASLRDSHVKRSVAGMPIAETNVYRVRLASGRELVATNMLDEVDRFGDAVVEALARRLPEMRDTLAEGRTVRFGDVAVDGEGISYGERRVVWSALASVTVEEGELTLATNDGPPVVLEWSSVPNARLLVALISDRASAGS